MANGDNKFANKSRVLERMRKIPVAARIEAREELRKQAAFLSEQIRSAAPVDEGQLRDSVEWHDSPRNDRLSVVVTAGVTTDPDLVRKARAVEFGRPDMEAQPFFFPTYRAYRRRIRAAIGRAIKRGIKKAID